MRTGSNCKIKNVEYDVKFDKDSLLVELQEKPKNDKLISLIVSNNLCLLKIKNEVSFGRPRLC